MNILQPKMLSLEEVLRDFKQGKLSVNRAETILKLDYLAIIDKIARYDSRRFLRRGVPEIIYAKSKTSKELSKIISKLVSAKVLETELLPLVISKINDEQAKYLERSLPKPYKRSFLFKYFSNASIAAIIPSKPHKRKNKSGRVALLAAGTSDIRVLNEAEVLLNLLGCNTIRFNDIGVAALHRLISPVRRIIEFDPDAIIVAAGMEATLPSVIASFSSVPVIGLPTSVGNGYGKDGEAALMSMLQACSLGISVVNIDSGVAAGVVAWLISQRVVRRK